MIQEKIALSVPVTASAEQVVVPAAVASRDPATAYVIPIKKILPVRIAGQATVVATASVRGKRIMPTAQ